MILETTLFNTLLYSSEENKDKTVAHILEITIDGFIVVYSQEARITKNSYGRDVAEINIPADKTHLINSARHMMVVTNQTISNFEEILAKYHTQLENFMGRPWTPPAGLEKGLIE